MFVFGIALLLSLDSSSCNNLIISKEKYTWDKAMEYCTNISALPVSSDIILNSSSTLSDVVWTSNTASLPGNCTKSRICGLMMINNTIGYTGNVFFGDCNVTRSYPCKENSESSFTYRNYTYDEAQSCVYNHTGREIQWPQTGFYWIKHEIFYCNQQTEEHSGRLCGVYGAELGHAFGYCSVTNFASCTYEIIVKSEEKYTWRDAMEFCANRSAHLISSDTAMQTHLNSSDVTWTSNTITVDKPCREPALRKLCGFTFNDHSIGYREWFVLYGDCDAIHLYGCKHSEKGVSFEKNYTYDEAMKCRYNLSAVDVTWLKTGYYWKRRAIYYCTQQTTGMLDVAPEVRRFCGVYGKDFGQAFGNCSEINFALCTSKTSNAVTGDSGNVTFTRQVHPTKMPGKQQPTTHLSMKIGVPVGVGLVLVCGVTLVILFVSRRRRMHKEREPTYLDRNKTEKRNSTRVNNTYELHTSVNMSQTESDQAIGKTVQDAHNNPQRQSETNSDYDFVEETEADCVRRKHEYGVTSSNVSDKEVSSSDKGVDNTGYCFAKEVDSQTSNKGICPDYHIYNSSDEDDGQYDAVTSKRQEENKPSNIYNHVSNRSDMESDYDSTIPDKQRRHQETDNVYNTFAGDGVDESNEYCFTGSMADTTEAEIEVDTYNTLNLK